MAFNSSGVGAVGSKTIAVAGTTNTGAIAVDDSKSYVNLFINVTAISGTSPTFTPKVQWSIDGTTWASADGGIEAFAAINATGSVVKQLTIKGRWLRIQEVVGGTGPSVTYSADLHLVVQE